MISESIAHRLPDVASNALAFEARPGDDADSADFRQMVEQLEVGVCITQGDRFSYVNPKFAELHGYEVAALIGREVMMLVPPDSVEHVRQVRAMRDKGLHRSAYVARGLRRDGSTFDTRIFGRPITYRGHAANLVTISDISELTDSQARLERLINYDPVTGLRTRAKLLRRTAEALVRDAGRPTALLFIRVPEIERVQNVLGNRIGELLAAALAQVLQQQLRTDDLAARVSGNEFAVLMNATTGADETQAMQMAHRVLVALGAKLSIEGHELFVEPQVGISISPCDASDAEELLEHARTACGRGEGGAESRVGFFTREVGAIATRRIRLEAALRRAFERNELTLAYQPQVDLRDGAIVGVEALLRWKSEEFGDVSPQEFVGIAEEIGLIVAIGEWVFRTACLQTVAWVREGITPPRTSVNLSPRQLEQADLSARLQAVLVETGADPAHIGIEVTESVLMRDIERARRTLTELSAIGIEIALDDFGTGYSNLSVLRALPFDLLKIDRSLVHDVTAAPEDVSITRAVLMLAQGLKIKVLAEGVETEGQLNLLVGNGCHMVQGYIFSEALPSEAVGRMLRDGRRLPDRFLMRTARQRTLLLVDDEENILSSLRRLLRVDGYRVVTARSGPEGLAALAEHEIDVIVSDQRMPGMTGVEFLRQAKELYPDTVRMALSGYTELQSITDAINEGAIYKFLTKPWDDVQLRGHIAEAFRRKELADENQRLGSEVRNANIELAQANERQQQLLARQRERLGLEEIRALNAQDLLENLPTAVVGIDADGDIAFVNRQARTLMGEFQPAVGCAAEETLPEDWLAAWRHRDGRHRRVLLGGQRHLLSCAALNDRGTPRGHLLSIIPELEIAPANTP